MAGAGLLTVAATDFAVSSYDRREAARAVAATKVADQGIPKPDWERADRAEFTLQNTSPEWKAKHKSVVEYARDQVAKRDVYDRAFNARLAETNDQQVLPLTRGVADIIAGVLGAIGIGGATKDIRRANDLTTK